MNILFNAALADTAVEQAVRAFAAQKKQNFIYGITGTQKSFLLAAAYYHSPRTTVVICHNTESIETLRNDFAVLLPEVTVLELPAADIVTFIAAAKSVELSARRMDIFRRILHREKLIILASVEAVSQKVLSPADFLAASITLEQGGRIERDVLLNTLVRLGYERVDQVDGIGQFSARGGIIDIFSINQASPIRLELFDEEIDSLREFDVATQRSQNNISCADILPLSELEHSGKLVAVPEYLGEEATIVFDEATKLKEQGLKLIKENPEFKGRIFSWQEVIGAAEDTNVLYLSLLLKKPPFSQPESVISITGLIVK